MHDIDSKSVATCYNILSIQFSCHILKIKGFFPLALLHVMFMAGNSYKALKSQTGNRASVKLKQVKAG